MHISVTFLHKGDAAKSARSVLLGKQFCVNYALQSLGYLGMVI